MAMTLAIIAAFVGGSGTTPTSDPTSTPTSDEALAPVAVPTPAPSPLPSLSPTATPTPSENPTPDWPLNDYGSGDYDAMSTAAYVLPGIDFANTTAGQRGALRSAVKTAYLAALPTFPESRLIGVYLLAHRPSGRRVQQTSGTVAYVVVESTTAPTPVISVNVTGLAPQTGVAGAVVELPDVVPTGAPTTSAPVTAAPTTAGPSTAAPATVGSNTTVVPDQADASKAAGDGLVEAGLIIVLVLIAACFGGLKLMAHNADRAEASHADERVKEMCSQPGGPVHYYPSGDPNAANNSAPIAPAAAFGSGGRSLRSNPMFQPNAAADEPKEGSAMEQVVGKMADLQRANSIGLETGGLLVCPTCRTQSTLVKTFIDGFCPICREQNVRLSRFSACEHAVCECCTTSSPLLNEENAELVDSSSASMGSAPTSPAAIMTARSLLGTAPEDAINKLPDGWLEVVSGSRKGEAVYENIHTRERQAWRPTAPGVAPIGAGARAVGAKIAKMATNFAVPAVGAANFDGDIAVSRTAWATTGRAPVTIGQLANAELVALHRSLSLPTGVYRPVFEDTPGGSSRTVRSLAPHGFARLQATVRMIALSSTFHVARTYMKGLQQYIRGYNARCRYKKVVQSVGVIQSVFRLIAAMVKVKGMVVADRVKQEALKAGMDKAAAEAKAEEALAAAAAGKADSAAQAIAALKEKADSAAQQRAQAAAALKETEAEMENSDSDYEVPVARYYQPREQTEEQFGAQPSPSPPPPPLAAEGAADNPAALKEVKTKIIRARRDPTFYCFSAGVKVSLKQPGKFCDWIAIIVDSKDGYSLEFDNSTSRIPLTDNMMPFLLLEPRFERYSKGTKLMVRSKDEDFIAVTVVTQTSGSRYQLEQASGPRFEMDLNRANHFEPNIHSPEEFKKRLIGDNGYLPTTHHESETVIDGLTGTERNVKDQLVHVRLVNDATDTIGTINPDLQAAKSVLDIVEAFMTPSSVPCRTGNPPKALLVKAGPGSGKSWFCMQALHMLSDPARGGRFIPLLIPMPMLANLWRREAAVIANSGGDGLPFDRHNGDILEWFLRLQYRKDEKTRELLLDAYHSQRLVLILDGLDEAVDLWQTIKRFVIERLVLAGHRCIIASRPTGVEKDSKVTWSMFTVLALDKLTDKQIQQLMQQQLAEGSKNKAFVNGVLSFNEAKASMDRLHAKFDTITAEKLAKVPSFDVTYTELPDGGRQYSNRHCQKIKDPVTGEIRPVQTLAESRMVNTAAKRVMDTKLKKVARALGTTVFNCELKQEQVELRANGYAGIVLVRIKGDDRTEIKAKDKYLAEVNDGQTRPNSTAISWVTDGTRATVLGSPKTVLATQAQLNKSGLTVVRCKNFYSQLDPTHLRRLAFTVTIPLNNGTVAYGEVQSMVSQVFEFKTENKDLMHGPYELFRELFGLQINSQLDSKNGWMSLTVRVAAWSKFIQEPVLLSLLIAVLEAFDFERPKIELLPSSRADLYKDAVDVIIDRRLKRIADDGTVLPPGLRAGIEQALKAISFHNHFDTSEGRRQFTSVDVNQVLDGMQEPAGSANTMSASAAFEFLMKVGQGEPQCIPVLKILEESTDPKTGKLVSNFQPVHLSLQEHYTAVTLVEKVSKAGSSLGNILNLDLGTRKGIFRFLQEGRHQVVVELAAGQGLGGLLLPIFINTGPDDEFFHGGIAEDAADALLLADGGESTSGKFLIRSEGDSTTTYFLSVIFGGKPTHYTLWRTNEGSEFILNSHPTGQAEFQWFRAFNHATGQSTIGGVIHHYEEKRRELPGPLTTGISAGEANTRAKAVPTDKHTSKYTSGSSIFDGGNFQCLHDVQKAEAEELLLADGGKDVEGKYLVRCNDSSRNDLILSVICEGSPTHHVLAREAAGSEYTLNEQPSGQTTLDAVVEHYQSARPGWPVPLTLGVPSAGGVAELVATSASTGDGTLDLRTHSADNVGRLLKMLEDSSSQAKLQSSVTKIMMPDVTVRDLGAVNTVLHQLARVWAAHPTVDCMVKFGCSDFKENRLQPLSTGVPATRAAEGMQLAASGAPLPYKGTLKVPGVEAPMMLELVQPFAAAEFTVLYRSGAVPEFRFKQTTEPKFPKSKQPTPRPTNRKGLAPAWGFSRNVLENSLLNKVRANQDLDRKGVAIYLNIMRYMGDYGSKTQCGNTDIIDAIMEHPLVHEELRDEVYVQIIKQLCNNPSMLSKSRGWELLWLCCGCFTASNSLVKELNDFLRTKAVRQPLADGCQVRLAKTIRNGQRKCTPHLMEIKAIQNKQLIIFYKVHFPWGEDQAFEIDAGTRAMDLCKQIGAKFGLNSVEGMSLFVGVADKVISVPENDFVFDFIRHPMKTKVTPRGTTNPNPAYLVPSPASFFSNKLPILTNEHQLQCMKKMKEGAATEEQVLKYAMELKAKEIADITYKGTKRSAVIQGVIQESTIDSVDAHIDQLHAISHASVPKALLDLTGRLYFMKKVWSTTVIGEDERADALFHYHQELPNLLHGYHNCSKEDAIRLASIQYRLKFGRDKTIFDSHPSMLKELIPKDLAAAEDLARQQGEHIALHEGGPNRSKSAGNSREGDTDSDGVVDSAASFGEAHVADNLGEWKKAIFEAYNKHTFKTEGEGKVAFLKVLQRLPTFGSAFFEVRQTTEPKFPENLLIAINKHGVNLIDPEDKTLLATYLFTEISDWSSDGTYFHMVISNLVRDTKLIFKTTLGYKMDDLITSYISLMLVQYGHHPTGGPVPAPPAGGKKLCMPQCRCTFEYTAQGPDELTLKVGDTITILEQAEEGWWEGTLNGKTGMFPNNFIELLPLHAQARQQPLSPSSGQSVVQGYLQQLQTHLSNNELHQFLLLVRSHRMGGTFENLMEGLITLYGPLRTYLLPGMISFVRDATRYAEFLSQQFGFSPSFRAHYNCTIPSDRKSKKSSGSTKQGIYEYAHDDVKQGKRLGNGELGDVYQGELVDTGTQCAIKTCNKSLLDPERFFEEADILNECRHPNIVQIYGVVKRAPIWIVLELCTGGDLLKYLRKLGVTISIAEKTRWAYEAASGIAYLHTKNCIHRDLAARNCQLDGGYRNKLKIFDFRMSRIAEDDEHPYTAPPTETQIPIRWTAPEALEHREWYTATDVWGYGVMIWEVYSGGKLPYAEFNNAQTRHEVVNNGHRLSKSKADDCPGDVFALLQSCWEADKDARPTMDDIESSMKTFAETLADLWA